MTARTKWLIIIAVMVLFFGMLIVLYPIIGGSVNVLVNVAPVVATLFFSFKIGAFVAVATWAMAIGIFIHISPFSTAEGLIRMPFPFLLTLLLCLGSDRIKLYLKQRKKAERLQKASEERYRLIFAHSADGIILLDKDGRIVEASPGVETHVGYSPSDIIGERFQNVGIFSKESAIEIIDMVERQGESGTIEIEVTAKNKDNQQIYLQLTLSRILEQTSGCRWICLMKNTTERREILAKLQEAQKMKAIGRLAGGVAHDINNILNAIIGSAHAHRHELARFSSQFEDLDNITSACNRGAKLTQNLLGFARKSAVTKELFSPNDAMKRVLALVNRTSLKNIRYDVRLDPNLPRICGDQNQIENALMNICINAQDAMDDNGRLVVETIADHETVRVHISDNGAGMDTETRRRVFEPFFTTKPVGKGTGLGLSMVYGVTQSHNGSVDIHSVLGEGTTVTLSFPKATKEMVVHSEISPPPPPPPQSLIDAAGKNLLSSRTVLLVDDEPLVLRAGTRMLQTLGCTVLSARSGKEAIEMYKAHGSVISLVILDLIMPDMDGTKTMEHLRALNESLPVLLASGYTQEIERVCALKKANACGFLPKPYHPEALIAAARDVLQNRAA